MIFSRIWRPSSRHGVAPNDQICFSDTIWPEGEESALIQFAIRLIPGAVLVPRDDVRRIPRRLSFHALQVNRYGPI